MPIQSLNIENYKSIRKSGDILLGPINVFIGQNGAGKSNLISFFQLLNKIFKLSLRKYIATQGGSDNLLYFGLKHSKYMSGKIVFNKPAHIQWYEFNLTPGLNGSLIFNSEKYQLNYDSSFSKPENDYESLLKEIPEINLMLTPYPDSLQTYHFNDTGFTSAVKQPANTIDYANLHEDGGNIAAFLYRIQEASPKHFNLIVDVIQSIAPFIDRFILKPDEINPNQIFLRWQEKGSEKLFSAANLSDGTLRVICLTALLLQPDPPPVIIIDEPELGLHPYAISKIAAMIKGAAEKTQVIIATQSVNLVNEFSANDIIVVEREDKQTVFKRQSEEKLSEWLKEYSIGELWEKNILGSNL